HPPRQPLDPEDRQVPRDPLLDARGDLRRAPLPAGRRSSVPTEFRGERTGARRVTRRFPMASTATDIRAVGILSGEDVSLFRLYVLRATYLLLVVGVGAMILPPI